MPLYIFRCTNCDHQFEKIVTKFDVTQIVPCPQCSSDSKYELPQGKTGISFRFNYLEP